MRSASEVDFVRSGPVARITIARPLKRNAISLRTAAEIGAAMRRAESDPAIRVVVLTGAGERAFAAGADLDELPRVMDTPQTAAAYDARIGALYDALQESRLPTIARIQAAAIGGGCLLALACDLRVASERATFSLPAARIGLMLSAHELELVLAQVTTARAKLLLFGGRRLSAREAVEWGLADVLASAESLDPQVNEIALEIAANAPRAVSAAKRMLRAIARGKGVAATSQAAYRAIYGSEDLREGLAAIKARRRPVFRGR